MLGVTHVCASQRAGEGVGLVRDSHNVDMVWHEAIRKDIEAVFAAVLAKKSEVNLPVGVVQKDIQLPVAALCDVMRVTRGDHSRCSRHTVFYRTTLTERKKKIGSVPIFLSIFM